MGNGFEVKSTQWPGKRGDIRMERMLMLMLFFCGYRREVEGWGLERVGGVSIGSSRIGWVIMILSLSFVGLSLALIFKLSCGCILLVLLEETFIWVLKIRYNNDSIIINVYSARRRYSP